MKQQDIATVIVIVFITGVFSLIVASKFITPSNEKLSAETVSAITPDFQLPDDSVFNSEAINPTVKIEIAPGQNQQPFQEAQQ